MMRGNDRGHGEERAPIFTVRCCARGAAQRANRDLRTGINRTLALSQVRARNWIMSQFQVCTRKTRLTEPNESRLLLKSTGQAGNKERADLCEGA